jgi:predicted ATPase
MKIKKLWISSYKNLFDVELTFSSDLITLFVGQNGLGKSNLLEALILIFRDLDLLTSEQEFEEWASKENHFQYNINYESKTLDIKIQCKDDLFSIFVRPIDSTEAFKMIDFTTFQLNKSDYLPDYVLGYYSGENDRIKVFFNAHRNKRISNLKSRDPKIGVTALGKMFFTEKNYGELLFFAMWVFKEVSPYSEKIKKLLNEYLGIELSSKVLIGFNNPTFAKNFPERDADNLISNIQEGVDRPFWGLTGNIDLLLRALWNNNSEYATPIAFEDSSFDADKDKNGFISFNDLDYSSLASELKGKIDDPIHLFDILQAADELGIVYEIKTEMIKDGQAVTHDFKELSEGERQLLTVLGLIIVTGRDDCLFLLDEPDTHLNPVWQRDFVGLLNEMNLNDDQSHIMLATHSPLIVQSSDGADVLLFSKADGKIKLELSEIPIHNWRTDHVLTSKYFGLESARPKDHKLDAFMNLREQILSQEKIAKDDIMKLKGFEEEGLFPTGETFNDMWAMHLIRSEAKDIENDKN